MWIENRYASQFGIVLQVVGLNLRVEVVGFRLQPLCYPFSSNSRKNPGLARQRVPAYSGRIPCFYGINGLFGRYALLEWTFSQGSSLLVSLPGWPSLLLESFF